MKLRPPATPIINIDPYFSIWTEESVLENTIHWTGKPNTMKGRVFVDGKEYHFLGLNPRATRVPYPFEVDFMKVENVEMDAYSTIITYCNDQIRLTAHFTSPTLINNLYYVSRPVAYCKVSYEPLDGREHDVKVKFSLSEELVLNLKGEGKAFSEEISIPGVTAIKMGNGEQKVLWRSGDDLRIDWGYLYLGVRGNAVLGNEVYQGMYAVYATAELNRDALFLFAYDDIESIQYFGENLKAYWKHQGKIIEEVIEEAANDYEEILEKATAFSDRIKKDAIEKGSEKYAELLLLSMRQIMAAHKLVVDKEGNNLYISKECSSDGCAATVDVTYPSSPLFLLYNPELLKGMLRPVMRYAATEEWWCDFAPHDLGIYPLLNGQDYWVKREPNGTAEIYTNYQMPVEECGNMIILFAAICDADNSTAFVEPYLDTLKQWYKYLLKYGLDPDNQLCTDDFAGHLAHNVNLSIKAIMGIAGFSRIMSRMGFEEEAAESMARAKSYAESLVERAVNSDGSFRLAYDRPETFSLKYNAVWDKLWNTKLFPESFYTGECARYKKELLTYGVPLDSREKYTKSDWTLWVASMFENKDDFNAFVDPLWKAYHTMRSWAPMVDWYYCDTSHLVLGFRHRTVQGGLFMKLLLS